MSAAVNGSGSTTSPADLAAMLRRSAEIVERRDFHPLLYQTMKALTAYAGEYAHGGVSTAAAQSGIGSSSSSSSSIKQRQRDELNSSTKQGKKKNNSAFHDVPDSVLDSPSLPKTKTQQQSSVSHNRVGGAAGAAEKMGASGGQFSSAAASASGKSNQDRQQQHHNNNKGGFTKGLIGIKKGFEKLGADIMGDHHHHKEDNDDAPFDEYAWCDEHFTRGCGCKQRKNVGKTTKEVSSSDQPESTSNAYDSNKKSKPCFQRPINPNSNLIANGWIDQQRRSKMRVVWKDVLASLVEGRRPGEETTLWIQRQVVDPQTGKVTGLEALHQIPMKWLEEVNYVDIYGDHRFTLKVYNFAEEFYFRTRDEQSAQSWVITLRSARDSSLENIGRMSDHNANNSKETPPMEMGLDYLDGSGKSSTNQTSPTDPPPTAQAGNDDSEQQRTSSSNQTPQQQTQTTSGRLKISELRAIAHGAGYDTRGMERKDLEKIAAIVSGSVPASPGTTEESNSLRHSKQKEAMMRDSERREREEREQREREKEERERAEAFRREQQAERDRAERERIAAEQRRQQEDAQRQKQIEEIKRRQEEERLKRMAEIQAEAKRKQDEENMRREQQQRSHIPTPPSSGGAPFNQQQQQWGQQQQQQYHQWQQQQQQQHQHHHAQYQQQAYANHHQPQQSQNPQFFNQQGGGAYQQSHYQQQQQQQQQQYQPDPSVSKYVKQMEEKSDEEQSAAETQIKRNILINWALQPPNLNALRPIDQLVTSIHTAMPPAFGVPGHNYFTKFTPISHAELIVSAAMGNHTDENKLKKAVRKVRVFLHPDKLPRDLSSEQSFMARMLWDITSDSWEEFQKHKDELDWIRS